MSRLLLSNEPRPHGGGEAQPLPCGRGSLETDKPPRPRAENQCTTHLHGGRYATSLTRHEPRQWLTSTGEAPDLKQRTLGTVVAATLFTPSLRWLLTMGFPVPPKEPVLQELGSPDHSDALGRLRHSIEHASHLLP